MTDFYGEFDIKNFVESLTGRLVEQARTSNTRGSGVFDPNPFVKVFENKLEELQSLKKSIYSKIDELEDAVQLQESIHKAKVTEMSQYFRGTQDAFEKIESRIAAVGNKAMIVGFQLESLDKQKLRSQEAKDLINYFIEFNAGNSARLDMIKHSDSWSGKAKCASITKRLVGMAKEMDLQAVETAKAGIEKYAEDVEKELLEDFNQAYTDNDVDIMVICAKILIDFNGGQSCIQVYVNQHEFFVSTMNMAADLEQENETQFVTNSQLPVTKDEYEQEASSSPRPVTRLYDKILETIAKEWGTMSAVFPNTMLVMQLFVQRIFAQVVQNVIETELKKAASKSVLFYLRSLAAIHASTRELIEALKKVSAKTLVENSQLQFFINTLNRCKEDIFIPYTEGERYIEKELKCLHHGCQLFLQPYHDSVNNRKSAMKNRSMFSKISTAATSPTAAQTQTDAYLVPFSILPTSELVAKLLTVYKEAVTRCRELTSVTDLPKHTATIFNQVEEQIGKRYLDACTDIALEDLLAADKSLEPDLKCFGVIKVVNQCVHLIQGFFQETLLTNLAIQPNIHREVIVKKNEFGAALESKLNMIIQKTLDSIVSWLTQILARQKKLDFRPKEADLSILASSATQPCNQACEYLKKVYRALSSHLDGKNLDVLLYELGVQFYALLLDHLKKFVISMNGGLILTKDMAKYQETISSFKVPSLLDRFETLRQISNIYMVKPENLKNLLEEGILSRIDSQVLHKFVANRADYKAARLALLFKGISSDDQNQETSAWEKTFDIALENAEYAGLVVVDTFEEVGESIKKMLVIQ